MAGPALIGIGVMAQFRENYYKHCELALRSASNRQYLWQELSS